MAFKKYSSIVFLRLAGGALGLLLAITLVSFARAQVFRPPSASLSTGDITSALIKDGTIVDVDVSATAAISVFKLGDTASGTVPFMSRGGFNASTSALMFDPYYTLFGIGTSSPGATLSVAGSALVNGTLTVTSIIATGTTKFGGVTYTWPAADGASGDALTTNGSGSLSFATVGATGLFATSTAGHTLLTRTPVYIASSTDDVAETGVEALNTFGTAGNPAVAYRYIPPENILLTSITACLRKNASPADSLLFQIRRTGTGNDPSTGTVLTSTSTLGSALSGTYAYYSVGGFAPTMLFAGVTYSVQITRTGANDATNNFDTCGDTTEDNDTTDYFIVITGAYTEQAYDPGVTFADRFAGDVNIALPADASLSTTSQTFGFTSAAYAEGTANISIQPFGVMQGFVGLSAGNTYYVGNSSSTISINPGTNSARVGRATNGTTMLVLPP